MATLLYVDGIVVEEEALVGGDEGVCERRPLQRYRPIRGSVPTSVNRKCREGDERRASTEYTDPRRGTQMEQQQFSSRPCSLSVTAEGLIPLTAHACGATSGGSAGGYQKLYQVCVSCCTHGAIRATAVVEHSAGGGGGREAYWLSLVG